MYVRRRPRVRIEPLQNGGGQERGLRSGTVPTPLVVGLGAACEIAQQELEVEASESELNLLLLVCCKFAYVQVSFPVYVPVRSQACDSACKSPCAEDHVRDS